MSCVKGKPCNEGKKRRQALGVLGFMGVIFVALSLASFLPSRGQIVPQGIKYADYDAVQGKRVFQAYNCMGCHTIVGNGAYLGPDLTNIFADAGPAWLEAFLPSAASWPTRTGVQVQLQKAAIASEADVASIEDYFEKYPAAAERVERRSAHATIMPNLPLSRDEIGNVIAFLKYTSQMDTEGWPPVPRVVGLTFAQATQMPTTSVAAIAVAPAPGTLSAALGDPVELGAQLVDENGCTACHAADTATLVGPGWGGLYGTDAELTDGSKAHVDDAYLTEAIEAPDTRVAAGFDAGIMPSYADILDAEQVAAIVAYIRSLGGEGQ